MYHFCLLLIFFRSWPMCRSWGWLGRGRLMYSTCWPETMFWRQRKMNFENIFILPNVIGDRSRRRFGGIFIKIPKVTSARSSLLPSVVKNPLVLSHAIAIVLNQWDHRCTLSLVMVNSRVILQTKVFNDCKWSSRVGRGGTWEVGRTEVGLDFTARRTPSRWPCTWCWADNRLNHLQALNS